MHHALPRQPVGPMKAAKGRAMSPFFHISRTASLVAMASLACANGGCSSDDPAAQGDAGVLPDTSIGHDASQGDATAAPDTSAGDGASDSASDGAPPPVDAGPPAVRLLGRF